MIGPLDRSQLHLVRGGAAANAPRVQPPARQTGEASERSPLARNVESLVLDAYQAGLEHGEQQHYRAGWRMGVVSGWLPGAICGAALVYLVLWLGGTL